MKNNIDTLLQKEMDRKGFIKHVGIGFAAILGVTTVLKTLNAMTSSDGSQTRLNHYDMKKASLVCGAFFVEEPLCATQTRSSDREGEYKWLYRRWYKAKVTTPRPAPCEKRFSHGDSHRPSLLRWHVLDTLAQPVRIHSFEYVSSLVASERVILVVVQAKNAQGLLRIHFR